MTEEDFAKITIETTNAIKTQFAIMHFGRMLFISLFIYYFIFRRTLSQEVISAL